MNPMFHGTSTLRNRALAQADGVLAVLVVLV